jgi:CheY-like chemotaxis protein/DNA-binding transcriptional ArsR family regulator
VRILVVDDDAVFREELADLLRDDGHAVAAAPSAARALVALEDQEYDLILTDLKMPRQSGLELLREARRRWPRTLVVMVTGFATVDSALDAMKAGAFDYIRKPFRIEQVRETLRLAAQEQEFGSGADARREPGEEARALAAKGPNEVLFFGDPAPAPAPHLHIEPLDPENPLGLVERSEAFLADHPQTAIVVSGVERFLANHRLEDVVGLLERLRTDLEGHGPLRVSFNPRRVSPSVATAIGTAVSSQSTHEVLEALANPIRRSVLQRLAEGPAPFGELMRAAGLDDSPKMSFHVKRLVEAGLMIHEEENYRLSARGEAGVRLLRAATFLPPASDAENLAFPRGGGGTRRPSP